MVCAVHRLYSNSSGSVRWEEIVTCEKPRYRRSADAGSSAVVFTFGREVFSLKNASSQYTHRLLTIFTSRDVERNLPLRSTTMLFDLPEGIPISGITVCHCPAASLTCRYGKTKPSLLSCAAAEKVLPSAQSTQPFKIRIAEPSGAALPKSRLSSCSAATPELPQRKLLTYCPSCFK